MLIFRSIFDSKSINLEISASQILKFFIFSKNMTLGISATQTPPNSLFFSKAMNWGSQSLRSPTTSFCFQKIMNLEISPTLIPQIFFSLKKDEFGDLGHSDPQIVFFLFILCVCGGGKESKSEFGGFQPLRSPNHVFKNHEFGDLGDSDPQMFRFRLYKTS